MVDKNGNIVFYFVVFLLSFMKLIIKNGGDVNVMNVDGCIFFYWVVFYIYLNVVFRILLKVGVDVYG